MKTKVWTTIFYYDGGSANHPLSTATWNFGTDESKTVWLEPYEKALTQLQPSGLSHEKSID